MNYVSEVCGCLLLPRRMSGVLDVFKEEFLEFMKFAAFDLHSRSIQLSVDLCPVFLFSLTVNEFVRFCFCDLSFI